MMTQRSRIVVGVVVSTLLVVLGGWWLVARPVTQSVTENDKPVVVATIFPLADLVRQVVGTEVEVVVLVPPGANEHSYSLTPQHLAQASRAQAILAIGHGLDDHLVSSLLRSHQIPVIIVDSGITIRSFTREVGPDPEEEHSDHHHDEGDDPHYWLTVPNAQRIVDTAASRLAMLFPELAPLFAERAAAYQQELGHLEKELQTVAQAAPQTYFIAMHNAWSYLAAQYGFTLVATYEPVEGQQPSLHDLQNLQQVVKQYGLTTFFAEPQKISSAATALLQREFDLTLSHLDPLGGTPGRESYVELMRSNVSALAAARKR